MGIFANIPPLTIWRTGGVRPGVGEIGHIGSILSKAGLWHPSTLLLYSDHIVQFRVVSKAVEMLETRPVHATQLEADSPACTSFRSSQGFISLTAHGGNFSQFEHGDVTPF